MKLKPVFCLVICLFLQNVEAQTILANKKQVDIPNHENRKIAVCFDNRFLPEDFDENKSQIIQVYSYLAGYPVKKVCKEELKQFRKIKSADYYIVEVRKIDDKWKTHCHAGNMKRSYSFYEFSLRLSENNAELAKFNTTNCSVSDFDYLTSCYVLNSLLDEMLNGKTWKDCNNSGSECHKEIRDITLYVSDNKGLITPNLFSSAKNVINMQDEEISKKLVSKNGAFFYYTYISPEEHSSGRYFCTMIINSETKKIVGIYRWERKT